MLIAFSLMLLAPWFLKNKYMPNFCGMFIMTLAYQWHHPLITCALYFILHQITSSQTKQNSLKQKGIQAPWTSHQVVPQSHHSQVKSKPLGCLHKSNRTCTQLNEPPVESCCHGLVFIYFQRYVDQTNIKHPKTQFHFWRILCFVLVFIHKYWNIHFLHRLHNKVTFKRPQIQPTICPELHFTARLHWQYH